MSSVVEPAFDAEKPSASEPSDNNAYGKNSPVGIEVICIGSEPNDPAIDAKLTEYIENILQFNIPLAMGEERSREEDLKTVCARLEEECRQIEKLIALAEDLSKKIILKEFKREEISKILESKKTKFIDEITDPVIKLRMRAEFEKYKICLTRPEKMNSLVQAYNARINSLRFVRSLTMYGVNDFGFDIDSKKRDEINKQVKQCKGPKEVFQLEQSRIISMAEHILLEIDKFKKTGGIILLYHIGLKTVHRLTALISLALSKQKIVENVIVNFYPIRVYPGHDYYYQEIDLVSKMQVTETIIKKLEMEDSDEILQCYQSIPCILGETHWKGFDFGEKNVLKIRDKFFDTYLGDIITLSILKLTESNVNKFYEKTIQMKDLALQFFSKVEICKTHKRIPIVKDTDLKFHSVLFSHIRMPEEKPPVTFSISGAHSASNVGARQTATPLVTTKAVPVSGKKKK